MTSMQKTVNIFLVSAFLLVLFFPIAAKELSLGVQTPEMLAAENRAIAEKPSLIGERFRYRDVKRFPERMEAYLADTLPFRQQTISAFMRERRKFFGTQPAQGVVGKDGWLYYNSPVNGSIDDFLGKYPLSRDAFLRHFNELNRRRLYYESRGTVYYFFIAPNKVSVYPEFLPPALRTAKGETRREQYMRFYREHIAEHGIPDFVIDPTGALIAEKEKSGFLYYPQDTHWNWRGRIFAGNLILDRLRGHFPDLGAFPDLAMRQRPGLTDLVNLLSVEPLPGEAELFPFPDESRWSGIAAASDGTDFSYQNPQETRSMLITGDSFMHIFLPLPEAFVFNTVVLHKSSNDTLPTYERLAERERIDIVVEEYVERIFFDYQ